MKKVAEVAAERLHTCPSCELQGVNTGAWAAISPWILNLGVTSQRFSNLYHCTNCDTSWFDLRYSKDGMASLYSQYRGARYVQVRNHWEPWYNIDYNSAHDDENVLQSRISVTREFLSQFLSIPTLKILDIGGDTGKITASLGASEVEVIELSDRAATALGPKMSQLPQLAFMAHVMEHLSHPIRETRDILKDNKCVGLYLEVPFGKPAITGCRKSSIVKLAVSFAQRVPFIWGAFAKPGAGRLRPPAVLRQSEHLTFFSEASIQALATSLGLRAHSRTATITAPDGSTSKVIQALLFSN